MLKYGEPNPLDVFQLRRLDHCPPHFVPVIFDIYADEKTISDWIYANMSGRFYLSDCFENSEGQVSLRKCAAFEISGEASLFSLILNTINLKNFDF